MIVFDLHCRAGGETFEAWFRSSADYEQQRASGLIQCPYCQASDIAKAPMAPRVPAKASCAPLARLAKMQTELLKNSQWVGNKFAETARAIHNGDAEPQQVHGEATIEQAASLIEDGINIAPLPLPVVPPSDVN